MIINHGPLLPAHGSMPTLLASCIRIAGSFRHAFPVGMASTSQVVSG